MLQCDNHPLAVLSKVALVEGLMAQPESEACVKMVSENVRSARKRNGEDEADNMGQEYKKVKVSPVAPNFD